VSNWKTAIKKLKALGIDINKIQTCIQPEI